jgi:hypothetical protein
MRSRHDLLFRKYDWFSISGNQRTRMREEITSFDSNRLLNSSPDELADYFEGKYEVDVPLLLEEEIVADQSTAQIDVSQDPMQGIRDRSRPFHIEGTEIRVDIPFTGDATLFDVQPTSFSLQGTYASISGNILSISISGANLDQRRVKSEIDSSIGHIRSTLDNLRNDASQLNSTLRNLAKQQIDQRRQKLLGDQNLVSGLGFKLKERPDAPKTYVAPSVRRKIKPVLPKASSAPYKPEPVLEMKEYEHVLTTLNNMAHVMERSPSAFVGMDEEALRTHFLVQLNGQYEGNATGETFNYSGKTDILLRVDGKNIFIGECKFWGGPKCLTDTLDQLLGYSSWRDTKVAILIFNTRKNFSAVLDAIVPTIEDHPSHQKTLPPPSETVRRFSISSKSDDSRELTLTVAAFDIPTKA